MVRLGRFRGEADGLIEVGTGAVEVALGPQHVGAADIGRRIFRLGRDRLGEVGQGGVVASGLAVGKRPVVVGGPGIRIDLDRLGEVGDGIAELPGAGIGRPAGGVGRGVVGIALDHLAQGGDVHRGGAGLVRFENSELTRRRAAIAIGLASAEGRSRQRQSPGQTRLRCPQHHNRHRPLPSASRASRASRLNPTRPDRGIPANATPGPSVTAQTCAWRVLGGPSAKLVNTRLKAGHALAQTLACGEDVTCGREAAR